MPQGRQTSGSFSPRVRGIAATPPLRRKLRRRRRFGARDLGAKEGWADEQVRERCMDEQLCEYVGVFMSIYVNVLCVISIVTISYTLIKICGALLSRYFV